MFTGIIENTGVLLSKTQSGTNIDFEFSCAFVAELQIDQSLAHNGVCLTVVSIDLDKQSYIVTAIQETLKRTNIGHLNTGSKINLERCTKVGSRLDGHIVQGHVDQLATCYKIEDQNGSWDIYFEYDESEFVTVEKGSITVNGVSLTVVDSSEGKFSISVIPYTYEFTNFHQLVIGDKVNIEFDIVGKYVQRLMDRRNA
ncbi:MAG: riboflavin synthase [Parvicella sp.]|jgi:riboflavin synthase